MADEYSYLTVEYDSEEKSCICHSRGMLWYIMIYYSILWYIMVYYDILWYIMTYYDK